MVTTPRQSVADLLGRTSAPVRQSTQLRGSSDDLVITVEGVGRIALPVPTGQAEALREIAGLAAYGRGEQTLTDTQVRDTWEVPRESVHVEWGVALQQHLGALRDRLGLSSSCQLRAELHSMLVYEQGQFFVPHQDSEKDDSMVATLVVSLPTARSGGALVVEDGGESKTYRGSSTAPTLVAFYADCRHEVRPVKSGHRITLTYNLLVEGDTGAAGSVDGAVPRQLAHHIEQHFATPVTSRYRKEESPPPTRLIYLLDHEYTARGLSWSRLKGVDAQRTAVLRAAADRADCEVRLALTEINETWEASADEPGYRNDYYDDDPDVEDDASTHDVNYLLDSSIQLTRWINAAGKTEPVTVQVDADEVCSSTRTADLSPYSSEYEGYMGNYGNTVDRWYRRAALVLWPRSLDFANRAELEPARALDELAERSRLDLAGTRDAARTLTPSWPTIVAAHTSARFLGKSLRAARALDDPELALMLLAPFRIEVLSRERAAALARVAEQYGDDWGADLIRAWFGPTAWQGAPERVGWLTGLPDLTQALLKQGEAGSTSSRLLVEQGWALLTERVDAALASTSTRGRSAALKQLAPPVGATIAAAAATELLLGERMAGELGQRDDAVLECLVPVLRAVTTRHTDSGLDPFASLARHVADRLQALLDRPPRDPEDWSIDLPAGCQCDWCRELAAFLRDPGNRTKEWPLATPGRQHIHSRIDMAELPVTHSTRRSGRPYTLVLRKQDALFTAELTTRDRMRRDLTWVTQEWQT